MQQLGRAPGVALYTEPVKGPAATALQMFVLQVKDQSSQLTKLHAESQLLESSLQDSQRQAMALGTRLALTENKNDELLSQTQVGAKQQQTYGHIEHLTSTGAGELCRRGILWQACSTGQPH